MKRKPSALTVILVLIIIVGLGIMLYPTISNFINSKTQSEAVAVYDEKINSGSADTEKIKAAAEDYNRRLLENGSGFDLTEAEEEEYNSLLDPLGTGMMGYIKIDKIDVSLPIYHGVDETTLQSAAGHIPGSSLPVGGKGTHTVISGHRGLPSAKLFTNLDELETGDTFELHILEETLTYQIDQIETVLPEEVSELSIDENEDYCTLVTCTPYGINTHRLLVRGTRISNAENRVTVTDDSVSLNEKYIALAVFALICLVLIIYTATRKKRKGKKGGAK